MRTKIDVATIDQRMISRTNSQFEAFDDAFEQIVHDVQISVLAEAKGGIPLFHEAGERGKFWFRSL